MKNTKHLFIVDDYSLGYDLTRDSSYLLINELKAQGAKVEISHLHKLNVVDGEVYSGASKVSEFEFVWVRKDPPVDRAYFEHLQLLSLVEKKYPKIKFINSPTAVLELNEKLSIFNFPHLIPSTLLLTASSEDMTPVYEMMQATGFAVLKPLNSFAGGGVRKVAMDEFGEIRKIIAEVAESDENYCMVQEFIPEVSLGDTRIHIVNGKPIGALLRVPPSDGFKGNIHAGGTAARGEITPELEKVALEVGAWLVNRGVFFAGIDTIHGKLTEINVTSPGVIIESNETSGKELHKVIIEELKKFK
jgi:glutathione synthase